jgi:hypothetical protein
MVKVGWSVNMTIFFDAYSAHDLTAEELLDKLPLRIFVPHRTKKDISDLEIDNVGTRASYRLRIAKFADKHFYVGYSPEYLCADMIQTYTSASGNTLKRACFNMLNILEHDTQIEVK